MVADAPAHSPAITPAPASTFEVIAGLAAPVLMMHGTLDTIIPVEQSRKYERAARALGKSLTAVYFEGIGHMPSVQPGSQLEARQRAIEFLRDKLK